MKKSLNSIKYGEAFRLGNHVLLCADSRSKDMVAKLVGSKKIKSVIIDPPYGVAVAESKEGFQTLAKNKAIVNDHLQSDAEYRKFTRDWIEQSHHTLNARTPSTSSTRTRWSSLCVRV